MESDEEENDNPHDDMSTFDVSPAAAISVAKIISNCSSQNTANGIHDGHSEGKKNFSVGQKLLLEGGVLSESSSSVFIQGLWDQREEAKFIAAEIRKRSKQRCSSLSKAFNMLDMKKSLDEDSMHDPTDVAIMVRTTSQMKMIQYALAKNGIPHVIPNGEKAGSTAISANLVGRRQPRMLSMKPVKLITMHGAKGDEFDDVYLASWTEGVFPHKSCLSPNRLREERRIAYVACTRARQRVVLTYSFMKVVSYFGAGGKKKDVTEPVEPSRFLFDLMAMSDKSKGPASIEWSDSYGFKEAVASKNLPSHYANSYKIPSGFTKNKANGSSYRATKIPSGFTKNKANGSSYRATKTSPQRVVASGEKLEETSKSGNRKNNAIVEEGLNHIFNKKWGSCGKYRKIFVAMLRDIGIIRGAAIVLNLCGKRELTKSVDVLVHAPNRFLTTRALSRCTAEELGLYLIYLSRQSDQHLKQ
jgi:hypothetical protein